MSDILLSVWMGGSSSLCSSGDSMYLKIPCRSIMTSLEERPSMKYKTPLEGSNQPAGTYPATISSTVSSSSSCVTLSLDFFLGGDTYSPVTVETFNTTLLSEERTIQPILLDPS